MTTNAEEFEAMTAQEHLREAGRYWESAGDAQSLDAVDSRVRSANTHIAAAQAKATLLVAERLAEVFAVLDAKL